MQFDDLLLGELTLKIVLSSWIIDPFNTGGREKERERDIEAVKQKQREGRKGEETGGGWQRETSLELGPWGFESYW